MIKGKKIITIDADDLLYYTNGGRDVYEKYIGKVSKIMKRPWGTDNHPSWGVFRSDGVWLWKDSATGECGTAIQAVQKLFNLTYRDAIAKIAFDFELTDKPVISDKVYEMQKYEPKKYAHITAEVCRFKDYHHRFWNAAEVNEDWCKKNHCYATTRLYVNRRRVVINEKEPVFVYLADDIDKVKVYFPEREKGGRFKTNVPSTYLWNYHKLDRNDKTVIHKSNKDSIVFSLLHPHNLISQSEASEIFTEENMERINAISEETWLFYGSDEQGVKTSKTITSKTGWKYINTPANMLPDINDVYSYVKKHGLKELENFCKTKGLL